MPLTAADHELTDSEILSRYGPLLERAISAFRNDPTYVVEMAEDSARPRRRTKVTRVPTTPEQRQARNAEIWRLHEEGLTLIEIAKIVGIADGTVYYVLAKMRKERATEN